MVGLHPIDAIGGVWSGTRFREMKCDMIDNEPQSFAQDLPSPSFFLNHSRILLRDRRGMLGELHLDS